MSVKVAFKIADCLNASFLGNNIFLLVEKGDMEKMKFAENSEREVDAMLNGRAPVRLRGKINKTFVSTDRSKIEEEGYKMVGVVNVTVWDDEKVEHDLKACAFSKGMIQLETVYGKISVKERIISGALMNANAEGEFFDVVMGLPIEGEWNSEELAAIFGQITRVPKFRLKVIG